jgi:hypothetical protein
MPLAQMLAQELMNEIGDLGAGRFQQEVAAVDNVNLGVGQILSECARAVGSEDSITLTPDRQQRRFVAPEVFVYRGVGR